MDTSKHVAIIKVGDHITVRVLDIYYGKILTCDKYCSLLEESRDGSIQCSMNDIGRLMNFQCKTLLIDYEVILDKNAPEDIYVSDSDFKVIDQEGFIHEGDTICDRMVDIETTVQGGETLYPGTRAVFRIHYDDFPAGQKVTSIIIEISGNDTARISMDAHVTNLHSYQEQPVQSVPAAISTVPEDVYKRLDALEKEVASLRRIIGLLTESRPVREEPRGNDSSRPMYDPGISYKPLDKK